MWLESKIGRRDRNSPHRRMFRRSPALWCLAAALAAVLAANAAHAGPLAPAPRVIAKFERNFLERSGSQTLEELLNTGIIRYFLTGGQPLLVLVNGRPYATTASNLDTLPVSAIERIELLGGDSLGTLGGSAVRGALNIVLRKDLKGFETRLVGRMPSREGGDGFQGSAFWGGAAGKGRMTLGVDIFSRQEIAARSREFSRSAWREGGAFSEAKNVSVGGNTVWVVQRDAGDVTGVRSVALGDCDPAKGYTGPLGNPPGIRNGDKGCGFAYGNIMWNSSRDRQKSAVLNLEYPLGKETGLSLDANVSQGNSAFRYAPSIGVFSFTPNQALLTAINAAAGSTIADGDDLFAVGHRFVSHGNRNWRTKTEEYDISVGLKGRLAKGLGYDARIAASRLTGSVSGGAFVHTETIETEIREGRYNLENPFSSDAMHVEAIRKSSVWLENDLSSEYLGARLALEGSGFAIGGRDAAWTAGVEVSRAKAHDLSVYRGNDGMTYKVSEVLGDGGASYAGKRTAVAAFAEMSLPLAENLDFRVAGRAGRTEEVGGLKSWLVGVTYRPSDIVTLRSSWSTGDRLPSLPHLYSSEAQDHPYIGCDPGAGTAPRSPCAQPNPRQVTRETTGNPKLDPSNSRRIAIGGEARKGPFFLGVEWYRLTRNGLAGQNSADWAMRNLDICTGGNTSNCIDRTGGEITIFDTYRNVVETELSGVTTRFGGGFRTSWGVVGMRGVWRRVTGADLRIAGEKENYPIARNMVRVGFLARRGGLSAIWTANYRSKFKNRAGTGTFKSWFGHDLVVDWTGPLGLNGARITAGVFNITDASLSVDTSNPNSVDGPTEAGWGRTFFFTLNARF